MNGNKAVADSMILAVQPARSRLFTHVLFLARAHTYKSIFLPSFSFSYRTSLHPSQQTSLESRELITM